MIDPAVREDAPSISHSLLRQFAGLWIVVFGGLALVNEFWSGRRTVATFLAVLAVVVGGYGLIRPSAIRPVFTLAIALTRPIGWVVSHLVLALIFYVVFTPMAVIFRVIGRDPLTRRPQQRSAPTFWHERQVETDPRRYLHQS
jgi:hypothetical protein